MLRLACLTLAVAAAFNVSSYGAHAGEPLPAINVSEVSIDPTYGYAKENPIKVGGTSPARERDFLGFLRGPNGESIRYQRDGSCCGFPTPNGFMGGGLLDIYSVWIGDKTEPAVLYINMYDYEQPRAPIGFSIRATMKLYQN